MQTTENWGGECGVCLLGRVFSREVSSSLNHLGNASERLGDAVEGTDVHLICSEAPTCGDLDISPPLSVSPYVK